MPRKTTISLAIAVDDNGKITNDAIMAEINIADDGSFSVGLNQEQGLKLRQMLHSAMQAAWPGHRAHHIYVKDNLESPVYLNTNTVSTHLLLGDLMVAANDLTDDRRRRIEAAQAADAAANKG